MNQFIIGLLIGIAVYIGAYFLITGIKKKRAKKHIDIDSESKGD